MGTIAKLQQLTQDCSEIAAAVVNLAAGLGPQRVRTPDIDRSTLTSL
jgi:hypothetical protein